MKKKKILFLIIMLIILIICTVFAILAYIKFNDKEAGSKKTETKEKYEIIYSYLLSDDNVDYTLVLSNNDIVDKNIKSSILSLNVDDCNSQYDENIGQSFIVGPNWTTDFKNYNITKVIIKNKLIPKHTIFWFKDLKNVKTIEGLENIDLKNVKDMTGMFSGCTSLTSLDLSSFNMKNVETTNGMFANCINLKTIYVNSKTWELSKVNDSEFMFYNTTSIVGENKTEFDINHTDKEYARIDKKNKPGYLTSK